MRRYLNLLRNTTNWWLHFAVKFGFAGKGPARFRLKNDVVAEVPLRLYHEFKEIFMDEVYTRGFEQAPPSGAVVVDIGANIGLFSLFAASRFPGAQIYACEPIPANYRQLVRNREINKGVELVCLQKAVAPENGNLCMHLESEDGFTTAASAVQGAGAMGIRLDVPCLTLERLFDDHRIVRCDLLKMDCEGSEYDILYGASRQDFQKIEKMAIEVHRSPEPDRNIGSLSVFLEKNGFRTRSVSDILYAWMP